jgi:hypothetical protein
VNRERINVGTKSNAPISCADMRYDPGGCHAGVRNPHGGQLLGDKVRCLDFLKRKLRESV